jgi:hypothetical protein
MLIRNLQSYSKDGQSGISADIAYESGHAKALTVFFDLAAGYEKFLSPNYEAFLLAAYPAALFHHEKRIHIEGPVCPDLLSGVRANLKLLQNWWDPWAPLPELSATGYEARLPVSGNDAAACFLSGGVDSMANLVVNVRDYPKGHPKRFKTAIFVYGLDMGNSTLRGRQDIFDATVASLGQLIAVEDMTLLPVRTNAREIEPDIGFYIDWHIGSLLGGIGHALAGGVNRCSIALDTATDYTAPTGSHPWLNKNLTSSFVDVQSGVEALTRIEKIEAMKFWPESLRRVRVCGQMEKLQPGELNCGRCRKCQVTLMQYLACGVIGEAKSFPTQEVPAPDIDEKVTIDGLEYVENYDTIAAPLRAQGRGDIADILERKLKGPTGWRRWKNNLGDVLKFADLRLLGGRLFAENRIHMARGQWRSKFYR